MKWTFVRPFRRINALTGGCNGVWGTVFWWGEVPERPQQVRRAPGFLDRGDVLCRCACRAAAQRVPFRQCPNVQGSAIAVSAGGNCAVGHAPRLGGGGAKISARHGRAIHMWPIRAGFEQRRGFGLAQDRIA
jgi:hypothetical protein